MKVNMDGRTAVQALPTITRYVGMSRGESMQEVCPHCGSKGTVIHRFECDDGSTRGAMSGCIQLFPMSYLAKQHKALVEKQAEHAKRDWKLNKSETAMLAAIEDYYAGRKSEAEAERDVRDLKAALSAWRERRYGSRGRR